MTDDATDETSPYSESLYEGCGEEGPIRAIFLAEFHHLEGPRIRCQASVEEKDFLLSKEVFDSVSNYIIPKPDLARQLITLNALGFKICGYPIILEDKAYERNIFIFNVCFVCYPWSRTVQYEGALRKLHDCLVNLEREVGFVSREENTRLIHELLKKILRDLNEKGAALLNVGVPGGGPSQALNLRISSSLATHSEPPLVHDFDVPVLLVDWTKFPSDAWDLTTKELLKYIDGFNHIARIAALLGVKSHLVKCDILNLISHGLARTIPILTYSDNYRITPKFRRLREDLAFQRDVSRIAALTGSSPPFSLIYDFISQLAQGSSTLEGLVSRFEPREGSRTFCERRLLQFLLLNGVLRKIHKYPVYIKDEEGEVSESSCKDGILYKDLNGQKHLDEIGVAMGISPRKLEERFESDPQIFILRK
eukprot:TRINITY_DN954_c0_g1_i4.p1 TRINITY_DN954_c0_g1~~TRINITY_DN954_c0_g1_i4.p1  ORF type:complete len:423 (-),score=139.56 TRINITY_DN954_c0_g1_i4:105-1373(-)